MDPAPALGESFDEDLRLLADRRRRLILRFIHDASTDHATIDELVGHVLEASCSESGPSGESVRIDLHHKQLPMLAEYGLIDYDPRSGAIRYRSTDRVEGLLNYDADT